MKEINKEIEKTFSEMDSLMGVLYSRFKDMTDNLGKILDEKKNLDLDLEKHDISVPSPSNSSLEEQVKKKDEEIKLLKQKLHVLIEIINKLEKLFSSENDPLIQKNIETRLNHLFDNSQPAPSEEERLHYSFYGLQEILMKIVNGLPALVNEKGEMNANSLTLLTNASASLERLENEQEEDEEWMIPAEEEFYEFFKGDEIYQLEVDLKEKKEQIADLREELASLKEAEKNKSKQLRQLKEKEQQARNEINLELSLIILSSAFPSKLTTEQLNNSLTRLREMESWLITGTDEQQKVIREEYNQLKGILDLLKEEKELRNTRQNTRQNITDALADKEKWAEVKAEELLKRKYRNYSLTLDEMDSSAKIIKFEKEILQAIAKQKNEYWKINMGLSWGREAIENKNVKQAEKAEQYLSRYRKLLKTDSDDYAIFRNKADEFHALRIELEFLISGQKTTTQIEQFTK